MSYFSVHQFSNLSQVFWEVITKKCRVCRIICEKQAPFVRSCTSNSLQCIGGRRRQNSQNMSYYLSGKRGFLFRSCASTLELVAMLLGETSPKRHRVRHLEGNVRPICEKLHFKV
ncbi:uncharacterized protein LACBIDRAFT_305212 [Laccaria bicolor S238N-H82]|uniref:Predicted protein n=1 Tax=Laccaria bicolor (strain S238N-H82 / ATCC MYA-4686) TaxID=486041 RepID=B0CTP5_LACBS|nr:uncharacterized protein LACBIDRAFT_305212 [Laccaria bicolor S238N-H82]EDR14530.1 predicted protein [Laccaria bicolor S238N-H82]|eukprot:XP_001875089.1 predicted protein [Laccaria bicolor S238N-H82]